MCDYILFFDLINKLVHEYIYLKNFNWRIIALQYWRILLYNIYILSLLSFLPTHPPFFSGNSISS